MTRAPIRVRLTAWYVLVLAAVLAGLTVFVVTRLRADLTAELDRGLRSSAARIAQGYRAEGEPEFRDVTRTVLPGPRGAGSGAQVLDARGAVLHADGDVPVATPLIGSAALARVLAGERLVTTRRGSRAVEDVRVVALPVRRGGRRQVVAAVVSLEEVDDAVHRALVLLLIGCSGALAFVALGGWWIARKALLPVEEMTTRADLIGIDDLTQRIEAPRTQDEVGHLAATLNAMLDRLQGGLDARERLVADASHELRAPLAAMRAELDVSLRLDSLGAQARAVLESVREEAVRLSTTVDDLLTLARADAEGLVLQRTPRDLRDLVEGVADGQRPTARDAGVDVTVVPGSPVAVVADGPRLEQVVRNLLDNAVRVTPRGGRVTVTLRDDAAGPGLAVSDAGPGIPAADRARIFERFATLDPARGRAGGAGLGLAIAREIVQAHGGTIRVEDREPHGSTFVVVLPPAARPRA